MLQWWSTYTPDPIAFSIGFIDIYWYGLCMSVAIGAAYLVAQRRLQRFVDMSATQRADLIFYIILAGILGARLYHVLNEIGYYSAHPLNIAAVWNGGLALHGGLLGGAVALIVYARRFHISIVRIMDAVVPGVILGQIIGRLGNFFNQELFGLPTQLPWKISIAAMHRPMQYAAEQFFHPTFLYEMIASGFLLAVILIASKKIIRPGVVVYMYLIGYSCIRFGLEFIRIDSTPSFGVFRLPQLVSLGIIVISSFVWIKAYRSSNPVAG